MRFKLLWPVMLTLLLPLAVAWFKYPETHLPPGFGVFPPQHVPGTPGFNWLYFLAFMPAVVIVVMIILAPKKVGFRGAQVDITRYPKHAERYPWWFWGGIVITAFFWWLMWSHNTAFGELVYWSFTPLWWGFMLVLDGLVYIRNGGRSICSEKPFMLLTASLVSSIGWLYFEYFDWFVLANWYYPDAHKAPWSDSLRTFEFLLTYSTITPIFMQWYCLLKTFPGLFERYQNGPKVPMNANGLIATGAALICLMVWFPYELFWSVWIGPMLVLTGCLHRAGIWTPFSDMQQGNWGAGVLIGLVSLFNGFFWELWNHGGHWLDPTATTNPNFWIYDVPYISRFYLFSEMPLLGYTGYLPFGVFVWMVLIWSARFFNFDDNFDLTKFSPVKQG